MRNVRYEVTQIEVVITTVIWKDIKERDAFRLFAPQFTSLEWDTSIQKNEVVTEYINLLETLDNELAKFLLR